MGGFRNAVERVPCSGFPRSGTDSGWGSLQLSGPPANRVQGQLPPSTRSGRPSARQ